MTSDNIVSFVRDTWHCECCFRGNNPLEHCQYCVEHYHQETDSEAWARVKLRTMPIFTQNKESRSE